jgi:hypothetical protein
VELEIVVADHEHHAVAVEHPVAHRANPHRVILEDHAQLVAGLGLLRGEAAVALEPAHAERRAFGQRHRRVEVEDVAVEHQLERPVGRLAEVLEETLEALVDEVAAALVALPQRVARVGGLGLREVEVAHHDRVSW